MSRFASIRSARDRYEQTYWNRQANPYSGSTRTVATPLLMYALYRRNWRLLVATLLFTLVNPVLFPERDVDSDSWFTRASRASETAIADEVPVFDYEWPAILNVVNVPVFLYALYATLRQRPVGAAVGTSLFMTLKFWYLNELVTDYDQRRADTAVDEADE
jgi:hypothetical protein